MAKVECPIEDIECEIFHNWLKVYNIPHEHIPNESKSQTRAAIIRGAKLKRLGVSPGYWDYDVYVPILDIDGSIGGYELIKIEMKRAKKSLSTVSSGQKNWGEIYRLSGIECYICYGSDDAINKIKAIYKRINQEELSSLCKKPIDF